MLKLMCLFATQKGEAVLSAAISSGYVHNLGCVVTFKEKIAVSFESEMEQLCIEYDVPFLYWGDVKNSLKSLITEYQISAIVAIGWRFQLSLELNELLQYPIIVFHDSLLPKYRGFAPTPTAIICGDKSVGVTILYASDGVDKGDIIWQKEIIIDKGDYIQEVIDKQADIYIEGFFYILSRMQCGMTLLSSPQDESQATYSIWRSPEDFRIDWSKTANEIYNFIRALTTPYSGAFTYYKNKKVIILRAHILPEMSFALRDYGKLWSIQDNHPAVICGCGMLQIDTAINAEGQAVIFDTLRCRLQ